MSQPSLRTLIPAERIQERIRELGAQIDADYREGPLYLVAILKGACFFLSDLARAVTRPVRIDFISISSYGKGKTSSGEVKLTKDLKPRVLEKLLIERLYWNRRGIRWILATEQNIPNVRAENLQFFGYPDFPVDRSR